MTLKIRWETLPSPVPCAVLVYPPTSQSDSEDGKTSRAGMMEFMVQKLVHQNQLEVLLKQRLLDSMPRDQEVCSDLESIEESMVF